ncbi:MAG TPA: hypothetical protein VEW93_07120 [Acidimicrobiales bacterium]|nr:hypothetical protein [Acidimicrobiales bacterium]
MGPALPLPPPDRPTTIPARRVVAVRVAVLALGVLAVGAAACADSGDGAGGRVALVDSLGFLVDDFGLTEAQVRCVAEDIEAEAGDEALAELAEAVRSVEAGEATLAELPPVQGRVVTAAIEACAVTG